MKSSRTEWLRDLIGIAGMEVKRSRSSTSRELKIYAFLLLLLLGLSIGARTQLGLAANPGVYPVTVKNPELERAIESNERLLNRMEWRGDYPLVVAGKDADVFVDERPQARAALHSIITAAEKTNSDLLRSAVRRGKVNRSSAYPVWVSVDDMETLRPVNNTTLDTEEERSRPGGPGGPGGGKTLRDGAESISLADLRFLVQDTRYGTSVRPSKLSSPLPFRAVMAAMLIVTPLVLLSSLFSNSFQEEKEDEKATLLFILPHSRWKIILGKSLPYFLMGGGAVTFLLVLFGAGFNPLIYITGIAVVLFYFSVHFSMSMVAKSFKDLSMMKMVVGSSLVSLLILPTFFINTSDLAFLSPLTLIITGLRGESPALTKVAMGLGPSLLLAFANFRMFGELFNEEDFLSPRTIRGRISHMFQRLLGSRTSLFLYGAASLPLALLGEALLLPLVLSTGMWPLLVLSGAMIEESLKNLGAFLNIRRTRAEGRERVVAGALSGAGFGIAERLLLFSLQGVNGPVAVLGSMAVLPIAFHAALGGLFGHLLEGENWRSFKRAVAVAVLVHAAYNFAVLVIS